MSHIQRRHFLLALATVLAAPRSGLAQSSSKIWRVGFIASFARLGIADEFPRAMRELGYEEGKNLLIEWRFANGQYDRLPALAVELVKAKPDVIVAASTPATREVKRATSTIPVVMTLVADPVASGFVASLARPGGNLTGLSIATTETSAKWFEFARIVGPKSSIGILADPNQPTGQWHIKNIQNAAQRLGINVPVTYAPKPDEIESAFASLARQRVTVVIVLPGGLFESNKSQIAQIALKHRIATVTNSRMYTDDGALLSYGQDYGEFIRRTARYVDRIFKGAQPSELPIEQPTTIELVVNLATAKKLGLNLSRELLGRADRVIE